MRPPKRRADELLAERGFAASPSEAGALILAAKVLVTGKDGRERRLEKAGERLEDDVRFRLKGERRPWVSRAGGKLEAGLLHFEVETRDRVALDLGLSTGGFTDCLLARGVRRVHGVDVAYGVVAWRLRTDERLILHERTNVRNLTPEMLGEPVDVVVADLSFIGLGAIWPVLPPLLAPHADLVVLVKPQFELPRERVLGGVVTDPSDRADALQSARKGAESVGLKPGEAIESPVRGREGNIEWLLHVRR